MTLVVILTQILINETTRRFFVMNFYDNLDKKTRLKILLKNVPSGFKKKKKKCRIKTGFSSLVGHMFL